MMCTSPLYRIGVSEDLANDLSSYGWFPKYHNGAYVVPVSAEYLVMRMLTRINFRAGLNLTIDDIDIIPCGQCLECKINDSKEWAQRSVAESKMHEHNYFITLTYDNEHLPSPILTYSRHSYEFGSWSPLVYEDFQDFKKRLLERMRDRYGDTGIRFLMCGEYGPTNGRPHFHAIFYGLNLRDIEKVCEQSLNGKTYVYMTSKTVEDCWGKGFITIGECNWETSAYVGRYVLKKFNNLDEAAYQKLCSDNCWEPLPREKREASRRPGLARPFYEEHKHNIYTHDKVILPNGNTVKPCKYFDHLYDLENPAVLCALKLRRKERAKLIQENTLSQFAYNKNKLEENKKRKSEKLKRSINKLIRPL